MPVVTYLHPLIYSPKDFAEVPDSNFAKALTLAFAPTISAIVIQCRGLRKFGQQHKDFAHLSARLYEALDDLKEAIVAHRDDIIDSRPVHQ